jgi:hypothetical protein
MSAAVLIVCSLAALAAAAPQEPDRANDVTGDAKKRLATIGFAVPEAVRIAERDAKETIASLDAQQDVLFPPGGFAVQFELRRAFGLAGPQGAAAMRAQAVASMARGMSAYYDPIEKVFVLLPTGTRETVEQISGSMLPLVVHELVHACQDARGGGLSGFFDAKGSTLDATFVRRCVIEGEAELAAVVAVHGEAAVERTLLGDADNASEKLLAGELTALFYQHGRRLAASRFLLSGWPGVRELWTAPPPSCEQVMHAQKLGRDVPQAVAVPAVGGTDVLQRTTIGELMIYFMLRERRLSVGDASLAAAGWDGDELVLIREGGATGLVWRSVWDRDEDAAQFAQVLPATKHTTVTTTGRCVDFVFATGKPLRDKAAAACAATNAAPVADEQDAESTAAVEAELRAREKASAVRGEKWELPELGLSIPVPATWELREVQGVKLLLDPSTIRSDFAVNVNVQALPRSAAADLAAMVAANRAELERAKITVVKLEVGKLGDADVIHSEFHGRFARTPPVHCVQIIYLRGEQQVVVTATASPTQWPAHEKALRELIAGIVIAR